MKTAIVSDLHDGAACACTAALRHFVREARYDRLVIAGDLHDTDVVRSLEGMRLESDLAAVARNRLVTLLPGNHDRNNALVAAALGLEYVPSLTFLDGGRAIHVEHGDRFDPYISGYGATWALNAANDAVRSVWPAVAAWLKRWRKYVWNVREQVRYGALWLGYDLTVCGHTHLPEQLPGYVNAGSWCEERNTYVTIENGVARLEEWK